MLIFSISNLLIAAQFVPIILLIFYSNSLGWYVNHASAIPNVTVRQSVSNNKLRKNAIISHHTQENYTTRFILIVLLFVKFLRMLFLLLHKPISNSCRMHKTQQQQRKQDKHQALARRPAEQYCAALKGIIAIPTKHIKTTSSNVHRPEERSSQPIVTFLSKIQSAPSPSHHST